VKLAVVGRGRVGLALGAALGTEPWSSRALPEGAADLYLLAVRDPDLPSVARALVARGAAILVHTAGGVGSQVLRDAGASGAAMLHPMLAFAGRTPAFSGALFAIEGDPAGRQAAHELCSRLGGLAVELTAEQLPAYHAACVLASNHVLGLVAMASGILTELGFDAGQAGQGLSALFGGVAANLASLGLPEAVTGPIARGDVAAVERNLAALASHHDALAAYRATAGALVALARQRGVADPAALDRIDRLVYRK
jgi:predicted short-subunit dehydrogenase-like oxidoreductase (DUF2520 family)